MKAVVNEATEHVVFYMPTGKLNRFLLWRWSIAGVTNIRGLAQHTAHTHTYGAGGVALLAYPHFFFQWI